MRVLHVIPSIAPVYGGPSQVAVDMCRFQVRQGVNARIATTNADADKVLDVPLHEWMTYEGVSTIFFNRSMGEAIKRASGFRQWLKSNMFEFDIIHIHAVFSHMCYVAADVSRQLNTPYIFRPLGTLDPWSMSQKTWRKKLFLGLGTRKLLGNAAAIHYTTDLELKSTETYHRLANGFVIPNGIDADLYQKALDADMTQKPGKSYLLYLGRIAPKKNIENILQAFEEIKRKRASIIWIWSLPVMAIPHIPDLSVTRFQNIRIQPELNIGDGSKGLRSWN